MGTVFAAVDLGATSGRVIRGHLTGPGVALQEITRFPNTPVPIRGTLTWDVLALFSGVLSGVRTAAAGAPLAGIGIDSWAVDYGLLDADGALLGNPVHYRDNRTLGIGHTHVEPVDAERLYQITGIARQRFNTIYQLAATTGSAQLTAARRLLLIPDLLGYWLTGIQGAELTNASTTALLDTTTREWSAEVIASLGIDPTLLAPLREPGTVLGPVDANIAADLGLPAAPPVITVASHDTASAVVAVPAAGPNFAYISCGTWSLVGTELDAPVLTQASRRAGFTNELGLDGTVRHLRNVMGLWLLSESIRSWRANGHDTDLADLLHSAGAEPALRTVVDAGDERFLAPGDMPARIADAAEATGQPRPDTAPQVVRCILDSLALAYRQAVREAAELSARRIDVVHLVGGGAQNSLLCQLTADATGLPVVAGPVEAAALGNILVQARTTGAVAGDLTDLRTLAAASSPLTHYHPTTAQQPWDDAQRRLSR